jgi:hypothetical protein
MALTQATCGSPGVLKFGRQYGLGAGADLGKLAFVRGMIKHAWDGYARNAWGANEIRPVSGTPSEGVQWTALFFSSQ